MKFIEVVREGIVMERGTPWAKALKPGKFYLVNEMIVQQLSKLMPTHINRIHSLGRYYQEYRGQDLNGKSLLVWRHGGIGDLMFMMPPLRLLRKLYPDCKLHVAIGGKYMDIYKDVFYVDFLHQLPLDRDLMESVDYHLMFERVIEGNPKAEQLNAYDLFLNRFGFDFTKVPAREKLPDIFLTDSEKKAAEEFLQRHKVTKEDLLIGIQIATSTPIRTYPYQKLIDVMDMLMRNEKIKIMLFGSGSQANITGPIIEGFKQHAPDRIIDGPANNMSLKASMAVASHCDVIVAPDSAMIHVAGGLRVPVVGLYGPFPAVLRMKYYHHAIGLNACPVCAPCFIHDSDPCSKGDPSPCFSLLDPQKICFAVEHLLNKTQGISIPEIKSMMGSVFYQVQEIAKKHMVGKGLDVGCGYHQHPEGIEIKRIDVDPMMEPDEVANFFSDEFKQNDPLDFIVCSFVLNTPDDLRDFVLRADRILRPGGNLIIFVGDAPSLKGRKADAVRSSFTGSFLASELDRPAIMEVFEGFPDYHLADEVEPDLKEDEVIDLFESKYGRLTIWTKQNERSDPDTETPEA
jgi:ADP-heptose:LPS heptosyltransferase